MAAASTPAEIPRQLQHRVPFAELPRSLRTERVLRGQPEAAARTGAWLGRGRGLLSAGKARHAERDVVRDELSRPHRIRFLVISWDGDECGTRENARPRAQCANVAGRN